MFKDSVLSGKNFQVGDIKVQSGSLSLTKEGYILGKNSLADWKGLTLGNGKDLFLATSESAYNSYEGSAIFPEDLRLRGKGEDFTIKFNKDNALTRIDERDNFEIKAGKGFEFSLENRNPDLNPDKKIPLMNVKGEFMMNQDSKTIYTKDGDVLITKQKDGVLFNKDTSIGTSTSPIELVVDEQKQKNKKFIVSNFNGVATVTLNDEEGIFNTDERYANSIYWKKASVENRYNYPTKEALSKIEGKEFNFVGMPEDPEIIRTILEVYEANPEAFKDLKGIEIMSEENYLKLPGYRDSYEAGIWDNEKQRIVLNAGRQLIGGALSNFEVLSHELGHNQNLVDRFLPEYKKFERIEAEEGNLRIFQEKLKYALESGNPAFIDSTKADIQKLTAELENLKQKKVEADRKLFEFDNKWQEKVGFEYLKGEFVNGEPGGYMFDEILDNVDATLTWEINPLDNRDLGESFAITFRDTRWLQISNDLPAYGIIRPYGANNIHEDVATFIETVRSDPLFFKGFGLIDETLPSGEKSPFYDSRYKEKLDLLKQYGFITEAEYNAVFDPKSAGYSDAEIAELMKKK
jgi:hypothetical protein